MLLLPLTAALHGDLKTFFVASAPRPWFGLSADTAALLDAMGLSEDEALEYYGLAAEPSAQGVASGRLKGALTGGGLRLDVHWAFAAQTAGADTGVVGLGTGVGLAAPELIDLTWNPDAGELRLQHRIDRLALAAKLPGVDLTVGRQPISFGVGRFFTPLDLVNPFHPATIDTEYKPGVDALRVDAYAGVSSRLTLSAAWAGAPLTGKDQRQPTQPVLDDLVLAAAGQVTVGVTDLLGFAGDVHGEPVVGLGAVSAVGPVGVHAEATLTLPADEDPFVRAVAGADGRPTTTTSLAGEVYVQSFGATDPADYLATLTSPRAARGEIWQMGQLYAALAVAQELTPLIYANASIISNLRDPSALLVLGGAWSVADNADVGFGSYWGLGQPPETVEISLDPATLLPVLPSDATINRSVQSEFGLYPTTAYIQMRAYF